MNRSNLIRLIDIALRSGCKSGLELYEMFYFSPEREYHSNRNGAAVVAKRVGFVELCDFLGISLPNDVQPSDDLTGDAAWLHDLLFGSTRYLDYIVPVARTERGSEVIIRAMEERIARLGLKA